MTHNKHIITIAWKVSLLLLATIVTMQLQAQQKDTLAMMRSFAEACNTYKQIPLQATLLIKTSANITTAREDSMTAEAHFYLQEKESYIQYGKVEQLVNDSAVLVVDNDAQRMLLYPHSKAVMAQLKQPAGFDIKDSSARRMASRYTISVQQGAGSISILSLKSKRPVYGSASSAEEVAAWYDTTTKQLNQLIQISRKLVSITAANYEALKLQPAFADKLSVLNGSYYAVKETTTIYFYQSVSHRTNELLPAHISDRIKVNGTGYQPIAPYENYYLSQY